MFKITTFDLLTENVHLVQAGGRNLLIDSGEYGKEKKIEEHLKRSGVAPKDVALIICTHGHYDHAGGARYFQATYGIPVMLGEGDMQMVQSERMPRLYPYTLFDRVIKKFVVKDYIPAFKPDYLVSDTLPLSSFGVDGTVFPVPGHTRGSLAIAFGKDVFVGDLFRGSMLSASVPRRHFFKPEVGENLGNIQKLLDAGYETFYCGHYGPIRRADLEKKKHVL